MENLDRSDTFWDKTNKLATFYKLAEFASYRLEQGGDEVKYSWALIACEFITGGNPPPVNLWKTLYENRSLDINVFVRTIMNCELKTGIPTVKYIVDAA
ncbi:MAG: hypothetical protein GWN62_33880, partial [Aliifodinibius sp.]|nr:hypothetical protein [Fodinibius sp.]